MTDILIGAADLYGWEHVRPWVKSIRESGFSGDVYLICYRVEPDIEKVTEYDISTYYVEHTPYGTPIIHNQNGSPTQAHNYRFYHAWELLTRLKESWMEFDRVIMTDVRDVIFQTNPSEWLTEQTKHYKQFVLAPPEHIKYCNEPWNENNLINGYGRLFYDNFCKDWIACNVGTIAGDYQTMVGLFHTIFAMTEGRYYPSDQSSFNVLLRSAFKDKQLCFGKWAAQLGTTHDPTKSYLWPYTFDAPIIQDDGLVITEWKTPYCLVHQWDRVPQLKEQITRKYADT